MSLLAIAVPRPRQPPLQEVGFKKTHCDFCKGSVLDICDRCGLSLCKWHALVTDDPLRSMCAVCYQRVDPQCLDCGRASTLKCKLCPQRLCTKCVSVCSIVHASCKQTPYCRDCAKTVLKQCSACASWVCTIKELRCNVCAIKIAICSACSNNTNSQCDICSNHCCQRCLGEHCGACDTKRCELCADKLPFEHCMAQYCRQSVCSVCVSHCTACKSTSCSTHTPPQKGGFCFVCTDGAPSIKHRPSKLSDSL
jgi:hypothetical protein